MDDEKIKKRILALMAKTTSNGCTEEEALSASKKVQEMLHEYQLDLSDLKIKESRCTQGTYATQQKSDPMVIHVVTAIAFFTDTRVWKSKDPYGWREFQFFGLEHDVLIAEYVTKICDWAIIKGGEAFKETDAWKLETKSRRTNLKQDYQYGMATCLAERLREMKNKQMFDDKKSTGRDLVVVKNAVVEEEFAKLGLRLKRGHKRERPVNPHAFNAGRDAGDKVALNPGVNQRNSDAQLK